LGKDFNSDGVGICRSVECPIAGTRCNSGIQSRRAFTDKVNVHATDVPSPLVGSLAYP
jgi:hypothetical protein